MDLEVDDVADKELVDDVGPNVDVSSCLFDYLDVAGLKTARLVCKAWADAGASKLIRTATLVVDGDKNLHSYTKMMGQNSKKRFQKYRFTNVPLWKFNSIFNSTGQHIKAFSLEEPCRSYCYFNDSDCKRQLLTSILLGCPNLEELNLFCPDLDFMSFKGKLWHLNLTFKLKKATLWAQWRIHSDVLTALINACPDLKSFNTTRNVYTSANAASDFMNLGASGKVNLGNLDELNFGSRAPLNNHAVRLFGAQKLNLSKLDIALSWDLDRASVDEILQHLSGTLTSFTCELGCKARGFPLVIPSNMIRLATVSFTTDNNLHFIDLIISASKLPNLNTLLLFSVDKNNENYRQVLKGTDFGTRWRQRQLELDVANCCLSLKTLQIPGGLTFEQVFGDTAAVFPNVTDLRLQNPYFNVIAAVFSNYSNLEQLSVKMDGYQRKFHNPAHDTQIWAGLKNMKSLKYFELQQQEVSSCRTTEEATSSTRVATKVGDSHLSEGSLLHGLQYLTSAVQIYLQGCQEFSKEAVEELKCALGPCCFLNIT